MNTGKSTREPLSFRTDSAFIKKMKEIAKNEHRTISMQSEMVMKEGFKALYGVDPDTLKKAA